MKMEAVYTDISGCKYAVCITEDISLELMQLETFEAVVNSLIGVLKQFADKGGKAA